jgi:hypothetical protein
MVSHNTGMRWLNEVLRGYWKRCVNLFRMDTTTLLSLCNDLEMHYGLKPSRRMSFIEIVAMFLFTIVVGRQIGKCMRVFNIQVKLLVDV